jgi:adenine/guanine/hypoxanthine permease
MNVRRDDALPVAEAEGVLELLMPFTYSIASGVALGFITYAVLNLAAGRARDAKPVVWVIAAVFLYEFVQTSAGH